jgi:3-oxoacyl-[acyl-carrier-protein] synthase-3
MNKQLLRNVKILSTGSYLPNKILFNKDLEKLVNTNSEWIEETLGIYERRIADKAEFTSDLAAKAALNAIKT